MHELLIITMACLPRQIPPYCAVYKRAFKARLRTTRTRKAARTPSGIRGRMVKLVYAERKHEQNLV